MVLKEKEVPYEFIPVDVFGGAHKTPEHLKKQPFVFFPVSVIIGCKAHCVFSVRFGQVPYIVRTSVPDKMHLFTSLAQFRTMMVLFSLKVVPLLAISTQNTGLL